MAATKPEMARGFLIGQAAALSGLSAATIRFYEKEGLVACAEGGANGYRQFSRSDVRHLRFIRLMRSMDMSLPEMRALLGLDLRRKADCAVARQTLDAHIVHVRERLAELRALDRQLQDLRARCDGSGSRCRLIEALHDLAQRTTEPAATRRRTAHV